MLLDTMMRATPCSARTACRLSMGACCAAGWGERGAQRPSSNPVTRQQWGLLPCNFLQGSMHAVFGVGRQSAVTTAFRLQRCSS